MADRSYGLDAFFAPRTVAVIGASRQAGKLGHDVLAYTRALGFVGRLYGVNPRFESGTVMAGSSLSGSLGSRPLGSGSLGSGPLGSGPLGSDVDLVPDLAAIDDPVDLALIAVPAAQAPSVVAECARAGVRAAIIAASGLGELGGDGSAAEAEMLAAAAGARMRLLGPNGFGLFVAGAGINLTTYQDIPTGRVALLTQSGNVAIALGRLAARAGLGFSCCVGVGNQLDVGFGDLVSYLATTDLGDAVALYLEGVAPGDGPRLRAALQECAGAGRPVVVLKGGRTAAGARAAATHTGVLGTDDRIWDALLAETGAVRVGSTEAMVDVLAAVAVVAPRRRGATVPDDGDGDMATAALGPGALGGGRVMVLTDGGGDSVLAVDALHGAGIALAQLAPPTVAALDRLTPPAAPRVPGRNPVTLDTAGGLQDDPSLVARCVEVAAADPGVDVVVVAGTFGGYRSQRLSELAGVDQLLAIHRNGTPILVHSAFAADPEAPVERLRAGGIPVYSTVQRLATALGAALSAGGVSLRARAPDRRLAGPPVDDAADPDGNRAFGAEPGRVGGGSRGPTAATDALGGTLLDVKDVSGLLRGAGIDVPPMTVVADEAALRPAAEAIGFPVCLKISQAGVSHKSDVGGVRLGVGRAELTDVADELWSRFPSADLLVMPMLAPGVEVLLGAAHDPTFGPFVTIGRGGVTAELDADVTILLAPVTAAAAHGAWLGLRSAARLTGWRGSPGVDLEALGRLTQQLAVLAARHPDLAIDLNPVMGYSSGYAIADLRAVRPSSFTTVDPGSDPCA
jgi:acyl-CoA synthetase (NDP forming)